MTHILFESIGRFFSLMHGSIGQEFVIFSNIEVTKYCWSLHNLITKFTILKPSGSL